MVASLNDIGCHVIWKATLCASVAPFQSSFTRAAALQLLLGTTLWSAPGSGGLRRATSKSGQPQSGPRGLHLQGAHPLSDITVGRNRRERGMEKEMQSTTDHFSSRQAGVLIWPSCLSLFTHIHSFTSFSLSFRISGIPTGKMLSIERA